MDTRPASASDVDVRPPSLLSYLVRDFAYVAVIATVVSFIAYQIVSAVTPRYTAQATILIDTGAADSEATTVDREIVAGQAQLIRSRDLARVVANALDLAGRPEFDPALRQPTYVESILGAFGLAQNPSDRSIEERVLDSYEDRLSVHPVEGTRVIAVDFTAIDPELAALAANTIADRYIAMQRQARETAADAAGEAVTSEIVALRERLRQSEARLEAFRADNDVQPEADGSTSPPSAEVADLSAELARVRARQAEARATAARIRAAIEADNTANLADSLSAPLMIRLVEQQAALRARIAEESATTLPQHPRMRGLAAQLADLDRQVAEEARRMLRAAEAEAGQAAAREQEILSDLSATDTAAVDASAAHAELRRLEGEAAELRAALQARLSRYREALADRQLGFLPVDARILSRAVAPIEPSSPRPVATATAVAAAVLALGLIVMLLRERSRRRSIRPVARSEAMPAPTADRSDEAFHAAWDPEGAPTLVPEVVDQVSESLTAIARQLADQDARCILIAHAADSADGRGTRAGAALARMLARNDVRVVLVDFRGDGESSRSMGEGEGLPGFSDLFAGEASFAQVIFRDRQSRVHFIPAGHAAIRPEALAGERLDTLLSALTLTYDAVLLDAPDALIPVLAPEATVAVVVSAYDVSDPRTIHVVERLGGLPAARVLLLAVDRMPEAGEGELTPDHDEPVEAV